MIAEFCLYCGAGIGKFRRNGEGMCPKCMPSEEFTCIGYKVNELLYYWRGEYWRWTRSAMTKDDPPHVFEPLTDEHKEGWILN